MYGYLRILSLLIILTAKWCYHITLEMVFAKTTSIIHCSIQKLADSMVEIATISMQSILTAKHGIHLTLAMVTAITTLPTIQKLADTMVEIVFNKLILKYSLL